MPGMLFDVALRCFIVDDSAAFVRAAHALLELEGIDVVGTASSAGEALQQIHELSPDVTLVDIDLGGESGLDLARRLQESSTRVPFHVILISAHGQADFADLIAAAPVAGFIGKSDLSADAIRAVLRENGN